MNSPRKRSTSGEAGDEAQNAIDLLKADHRGVDQLFEQFKSAKGRSQRKKLVEKIATALNAHTIIEEEIFYPTCSRHGVEEDDLDEAQVEHDTIKLLVRELLEGHLDDDYYDAKVTVLSEYVKHHVKEEEEPEKGIFARIEKTDCDLKELGRELKERKAELMEDEERLIARPPRIRSLSLSRGEYRGGNRGREDADWGPIGNPRSADRPGEWAGRAESGDYYYGSHRQSDEDRFRGGPERRGPGRRGGYSAEGGAGPGGWYGDPRRHHPEPSRRGGR